MKDIVEVAVGLPVFKTFHYRIPEKMIGALQIGMRVLVPSLESAAQAYLKQDLGWFSDFPVSCKSAGGKFFNFMLCDSQHKSMFQFSFMEELFDQEGFPRVTRETLGNSRVFPEATVK